MKTLNWKKTMMSLAGISIMAIFLGSCGSDNKVAVTPAPDTADTSESTATTDGTDSCVSVNSFTEFKDNVVSGNFIRQSSNYERYIYNECEVGSKWIFTYTKCNDSFSRESNLELDSIDHEMATTRTELLSDLSSIVNTATNYQYAGGSSFYIQVSSGDVYGINLCAPLAANPVYFSDGDEAYKIR